MRWWRGFVGAGEQLLPAEAVPGDDDDVFGAAGFAGRSRGRHGKEACQQEQDRSIQPGWEERPCRQHAPPLSVGSSKGTRIVSEAGTPGKGRAGENTTEGERRGPRRNLVDESRNAAYDASCSGEGRFRHGLGSGTLE